MAFHQVLSHEYYAKVHADIRSHMDEAGIDLLLLDSNDDVIYTTGFSHYTTERPVVFAITRTGAFLLCPSSSAVMPRTRTLPPSRSSISSFRASIVHSASWAVPFPT
jgi:Xaa-Pro aminopeptidase